MVWTFLRRKEPTADPAHAPPLLANRYRVGAKIGEGAAAEVFAGVDMRSGGQVAIKRIALPAGLDAAARADWHARLRREAEVAMRLAHPDILAVLESGLTEHWAWMVMERVHGADLSRYTQRSRLLPEALVLRIGARLGAALAHAHGQGIVHRDLKPANVLVDLAQGQVKLADFGVARQDDAQLTRTGLTLGTPSYMAPELLAGDTASPASDAYALGVMAYELLAGRRPHQASTLGELLRATSQQPPTPLGSLRPDLPPAVLQSVMALLARQPQQRPADLAAWAAELSGLALVLARVLSPGTALRL